MDPSVFFWVAGMTIVPGLAWAAAVMWMLRDLRQGQNEILIKLNHPEQFGLSSREAEKRLENIQVALQTLVHYVRWQAEQVYGKEPPPPLL